MPTPVIDPLLDLSSLESAFEWEAVEAEFAQREMWAKTAKLYALTHRAMRSALRHPEVFVDPAGKSPREALDLARRSAALDLASRMRSSDITILNRWHAAETLIERLPRFWTHFLDGEVSEAQAKVASRAAGDLPQEVWAPLDDALAAARNLTDAKFAIKARTLRERLHPEPMTARHERALENRTVGVDHSADGMSWLSILQSSEQIALARANIDSLAWKLYRAPDETRTMPQLRADVASGLLMGTVKGSRPTVSPALLVPVLSMLDQSDELPTLEGVGPIDIETAKRLVGEAKSFIRVLTDPITGTVLDIDRDKYKVPKAMRRYLQVRDVTCRGPGCNRQAGQCDIDHTVPYGEGHNGKTAVKNLAHLCRSHHTVNGNTRWKVEQAPDGTTTWTSPTGHVAELDPPPF